MSKDLKVKIIQKWEQLSDIKNNINKQNDINDNWILAINLIQVIVIFIIVVIKIKG